MFAPARPDWRWVRAVELSEYTGVQLSTRLRQEDEWTQRIVQFKQAQCRNMEFQFPELESAHEVYSSRPSMRLVLEGLLLAGASNDTIREHAECSDRDINSYVAAYFDVRDRKPATICEMVFQGMPHANAHAHDRLGIAHRIAWLAGLDVFIALISRNLSTAEMQAAYRSLAMDVMLRQSSELALTASARTDQASEILHIALTEPEHSVSPMEGDNKTVMQFIKGIASTVADPADSANLPVPARELREHEHFEVINA